MRARWAGSYTAAPIEHGWANERHRRESIVDLDQTVLCMVTPRHAAATAGAALAVAGRESRPVTRLLRTRLLRARRPSKLSSKISTCPRWRWRRARRWPLRGPASPMPPVRPKALESAILEAAIPSSRRHGPPSPLSRAPPPCGSAWPPRAARRALMRHTSRARAAPTEASPPLAPPLAPPQASERAARPRRLRGSRIAAGRRRAVPQTGASAGGGGAGGGDEQGGGGAGDVGAVDAGRRGCRGRRAEGVAGGGCSGRGGVRTCCCSRSISAFCAACCARASSSSAPACCCCWFCASSFSRVFSSNCVVGGG